MNKTKKNASEEEARREAEKKTFFLLQLQAKELRKYLFKMRVINVEEMYTRARG
jgi:hypothetical protein